MSIEQLIALTLFAVVSLFTPGPNNFMLMTSGANFGFKKSLPHLFGVNFGFAFMVVLVGVGLMGLFDAVPASYTLLKYLSMAYLFFLAYKIALSKPMLDDIESSVGAMTFFQAVAFQWVNPKAWTMALSSISVYAPTRSIVAVLIVGSVFAVFGFFSSTTWVLIGRQIQSLLTNMTRVRVFNGTMAFLLVASMMPILLNQA